MTAPLTQNSSGDFLKTSPIFFHNARTTIHFQKYSAMIYPRKNEQL